MRIRLDRRGAGLLLATAVLAGSAGAAGAAAAEATPGPTGRGAALVFLDSWPQTILPFSVAELRAVAEGRLEEVLRRSGHEMVANATVVSCAGRWRARSAVTLPAGFLATLQREHGVTVLVLAQLQVEPDRLILLARSLEVATGLVRQVWLAEQPLESLLVGADPDAEAAALRQSLQASFARLATASDTTPARAGARAVMLPVVAVGCRQGDALTATYSLLQQALALGQRSVIDPGVVVTALHDAGHDQLLVGRDARNLLAETFGADLLLQPTLVAYGDGGNVREPLVGDDEDGPWIPRSAIQSFSLVLRGITLRDGVVVASADVYYRHQGNRGWFGVEERTSLLERLTEAASALWREFRVNREES